MIEYSATLRIGFVVDTGSVLDSFRVELPELSHTEPRWDPRTGKRVPDLKIVDQEAGSVIQVDDEVYDDDSDAHESQELFDHIVRHLGLKCGVDILDDGRCIFHITSPRVKPPLEVAGLTCGGSAPFQSIIALAPRLTALRAKLKRAGIKTDEAQAVVVGRMEE